MDFSHRISQHFEENNNALTLSAEQLNAPLVTATQCLIQALDKGNKVLACGNGGSAADAQHFIAELVGRFERERKPLPGIALNTDTSILTAVGNDYGYNTVFSRQVEALGVSGDVLVAITTSGNSTNVIEAIKVAHEKGIRVIALSGKKGGALNQLLNPSDIHLCVPHDRTMRIQEIHILLLHILCDGIDLHLLGD
ncbi:phosphoheptose isomerase [Pelistega indica]|uniref:Phosphoheptose isomerase n=1 Tax=Pelistega indica TaxID=1414851 RepID=V8G050_9BURK|nr:MULTISPECIES: phosphoheptose isomerase [Pelistega]ETD69894.1 phosphoheptose isomerase [Pelistega indica]